MTGYLKLGKVISG